MRFVFVISFLLTGLFAFACQCPITPLDLKELNKYDIIFKGKVKSVKECGVTPGEAVFSIDELFRGRIPDEFTVVFDCDNDCALGFNVGEEWIIYTNFRQISNARMDWCSRSRKFFAHSREDFYLASTGIDYFEELAYLRTNLGHLRFVQNKNTDPGHRNKRYDLTESALAIVLSVAGLVVFYLLFRRFFK